MGLMQLKVQLLVNCDEDDIDEGFEDYSDDDDNELTEEQVDNALKTDMSSESH